MWGLVVMLLVVLPLLLDSAPLAGRECCSQTHGANPNLARLRGGRGYGENERTSGMKAGANCGDEHESEAQRSEWFEGQVDLAAEKHSLAHIVENAKGPLRIRCCWPGDFWEGAAAIKSPYSVDIVGGEEEDDEKPILAGQWFLMEGSHGCFQNITLVHRSR